MTVEKADAIALAKRWMSAVGMSLDTPDGVRVDHDNVRRGPEGWEVPWDNVAFLDGGDTMQRIFPPPRLIVTEPEGELRSANTTPHPGFSAPVDWPGQPRYLEIIDPEYREAGFHALGVPRHAVAGWQVEHPDGSREEQPNPDYRVGPERAGFPRSQNPLEALLNYQAIRLQRAQFLVELLKMVVLVPVGNSGDDVAVDTAGGRRKLDVYSSPRKIPQALRWLRMTVPTFAERFPGTAMVLNPQSYPSTEVTAEELARTCADYPGFRPEETQLVTEIGPDGSLDQGAEEIRQRFGLESKLGVPASAIRQARESGYDLTGQERQRMILGQAWYAANAGALVRANRFGGLADSGDDISGQSWPPDLHANGLLARHDDAGRLRPDVANFGKFPTVGGSDLHRCWHAVVGAYAGFALGDALGSAVDGWSWQEIRARFGARGVQGMEPAFDRPGQVSWRTQLLLFLTEGAIRCMDFKGPQHPSDVTAAIASAHARWLSAQGVPWQQAAGPLAARHPEPDGFLSRVPEARFRRGVPDGLPAAVQRAVADPSQDTGLRGPMMLMWSLPEAISSHGAGSLAYGWHRAPADVAAADALSGIFFRLTTSAKFVNPTWMQLLELLDQEFREPAGQAGEQVAGTLRHVADRRHEYLADDVDELEAIGTGQDTTSVLGRALLAAAKREAHPRVALLSAVNHSGRSALTGALAGALIGARTGVAGLPQDWLEALDLTDLVQEIADDAYWNFGRRNPYHDDFTRDGWLRRYPRW